MNNATTLQIIFVFGVYFDNVSIYSQNNFEAMTFGKYIKLHYFSYEDSFTLQNTLFPCV